MKGMAQPTERHFIMWKRAGKYFPAFPRVVQLFPVQRTVTCLATFCDVDHAGCIHSRKSTTRVIIMFGSAVLKTVCRAQALIAVSREESEFYGLTSSARESLGERSFAMDLRIKLELSISTHATACAAISSRKSFGRVKNISTRCSHGCKTS